ncbi:hypothetical protein R3P38DRAFT_3253558 [Favolaschia claudopus]|uniref:Fungal-type protein kinase domain-containing protein n=1 Tax=Favolaschia claudopus TaxID=2862362 RepID=A0AAW0DVG0_9AGAR
MPPPAANVTAFVGRIQLQIVGASFHIGRGDLLVLWNYLHRKLIVVEALGLRVPADCSDERYDEMTYTWVEKIQNLIGTIDFEHEGIWAYLVDSPSAGLRIIQRPTQERRLPHDFLWAQCIDLSEIQITKLWFEFSGRGRGIWRGTEYDIHIAFIEPYLTELEKETKAFKALQGLDLTYEAVAHIFIGDIVIVKVSSHSNGKHIVLWFVQRLITKKEDRAVVFAALAKLERAFMVHRDLRSDQQLVIDAKGQVRFLDIQRMLHFSPDQREQLEIKARECHWDNIGFIFRCQAIITPETAALYGLLWYKQPISTFLAKTPSPERLFFLSFYGGSAIPMTRSRQKDEHTRQRHGHKASKHQKTLSLGSSPLKPRQTKSRDVPSKPLSSVEPSSPPPRYYTQSPGLPSYRYAILEFLPKLQPETAQDHCAEFGEGGASIVELE